MKKVLLSLLCVFAAVFSGFAEDASFTASALESGKWKLNDIFTFTFSKAGGQTEPTYNTSGKDIRLYASGTATLVAAEGYTIEKVVFNISTNGKKRLAPVTANSGTIASQAANDETVTWTGSESSVVFTVGEKANYGSDGASKAGQLCFSSVDITYSYLSETGKTDARLSYPKEEYIISLNDAENFEAPMLSNPNNIEGITYSYVANPDELVGVFSEEDGDLLLEKMEGTVVVTASFAGNDEYEAEEVSYTIIVSDVTTHEVIFDFTADYAEYGMTQFTSGSNYNEDNTTFGKEWIKATVNSHTRIWKEEGLRMYKSGVITFEAPEGINITELLLYHYCEDTEEAHNESDAKLTITNNVAEFSVSANESNWDAGTHHIAMAIVRYVVSSEEEIAIQEAFKSSTSAHFTMLNGNTEIKEAEIEHDPKGEAKLITLSHNYPHAKIYTKWTDAATLVEPSTPEAETMYYDVVEGFSEHTAPIEITKAGTLEYYAEVNGHQTGIQTLTVKDSTSTGIEAVEAQGAVELFDLQGRRVASPARGIFVGRQNGKSVKVRL